MVKDIKCPICHKMVPHLFPCVKCSIIMCEKCAGDRMYEVRGMAPRKEGKVAHFNICMSCGKELYMKGLTYQLIQAQ